MADFLMKPKVDFAFKEIMTDELARIGFLSAILKSGCLPKSANYKINVPAQSAGSHIHRLAFHNFVLLP